MGDSQDLEGCREDILVSQNQDPNEESADLSSEVEGGPSDEQIVDDIPPRDMAMMDRNRSTKLLDHLGSMSFATIEEAWTIVTEYAKSNGFSIHKQQSKKYGPKCGALVRTVKRVYFACKRSRKPRLPTGTRKTISKRTDCKW